jgi:hypothetical protein
MKCSVLVKPETVLVNQISVSVFSGEVQWYRFFEFWLGLPSKNDVRAAIEKLSEMTRCLRSAMPDGRFDLERRAQAPTLGREVMELLKRRRSPS